MKILLTANTSFKLVNFRSKLMRELLAAGHQLVALVPEDDCTAELEALGVRVLRLRMDRDSVCPLVEAAMFWRVLRALCRERPDLVFGYTIKNNIYGSLAAALLGVPFVPNVTGLGSAFSRPGWLAGMVKRLYQVAFRRCPTVFLQNRDDLRFFLAQGLIRTQQARLLPGSGVDLEGFAEAPLPGRGGAITFLLLARMLQEKGIREFAQAASRLGDEYPQASFLLLGRLGTGRPGGMSSTDIEALCSRENVSYLGEARDVRRFIRRADCIVLPSYYREGTPRSLLEGAAMGRPLITTDMPGCRDVVNDGESGYLCRPRDADDLTAAMRRFLMLSDAQRRQMGGRSRAWIGPRYDDRIVIGEYLQVITRLQQAVAVSTAGEALRLDVDEAGTKAPVRP